MNLENMVWSKGGFEKFDAAQWYEILSLRSAVFIVEQQCPYQDLDGLDHNSVHLVGWHKNEAGLLRAVAAGRVVRPGCKYAEPSIGRVVNDVHWRGHGLGIALMLYLIELSQSSYNTASNRISAQAYLERFYTKFGFKRVSDTYLEDGIPHIEMLRSGCG